MFKVRNLSYKIQNKEILKDISIDIKSNNFLSIVGPNGCGKSTLIKTINRNLSDYEGNISLENKDINSFCDKELALKRAVLNQSFYFPYSFKAIEIVEMGLYSYSLEIKEKKKILEYIVDKLDISLLSQKDYQGLSGGEKQKIQFARVVAQIYASCEKQKFLFLDEPTLNLDIYYQYKILDLTKELVMDLNIGVCAILHDINQAYMYSDEVLMMKDGQVRHFGNTQDILTSKNILDVFNVQSDFVYSEKLNQEILVTHAC